MWGRKWTAGEGRKAVVDQAKKQDSRSEFEHLLDLRGSTDERSSQSNSLADKSLSTHALESSLGKSNEDESSLRGEELEEERLDGEVVVEGSAKEDVKVASPLLGAGGLVLGDDEVLVL